MNVKINGKQLNIGVSLSSHAEIKIKELIFKYSKTATDSSVTFSKDRYEFLCDISIHLSTGMTVQAKGKATDIYESFEKCLDKITKQLRRYKRRLKNHHNDRNQPIEFVNANSYVIFSDEENDSSEKESLEPLIIAEMQEKIPTLSVGEAVMQMQLAGSNILIFKNSSHKKINIIHLRDDGNIGWVDPEHSN